MFDSSHSLPHPPDFGRAWIVVPVLALLATMVMVAAVARSPATPEVDEGAVEAEAAVAPFVNAEVRGLDAAHAVVTLRHEKIVNLDMRPMTMAFAVSDQRLLAGIRPGDKVRARFEFVKNKLEVTALESAK
jgi:Cu/Ag efflux protein CusF